MASLKDVLAEIEADSFKPSTEDIEAAKGLLLQLPRMQDVLDKQKSMGIDVNEAQKALNESRDKLQKFVNIYG